MADGDGTQSGAEGTQSGTGDDTTTTANTGTTGEGTQSGTQTTHTDDEAQRARTEAESLRERMKAADARAARFENELKQLKDKDLPAAEKLQRDFENAQNQVTQLQSTNRQLALKVAFLSDNTYSWHNPERALKLVDLDQLDIDADGKVSGLKDALKALATSDPYLVKQDVKQEENKTPPGTAPGNNGANGSGKTPAKGLESRFPILRTRVTR
jgi:HPt (histidine-containing phosphotransfer) domain-containing protein